MDLKKLLLDLKSVGSDIENSGISFENIKEILITAENKTCIFTDNKRTFIKKHIVTAKEIRDIFASLCEYSVHAYNDEIKRGYITANGGVRIGICGTAVYEKNEVSGIKDISSLNVRIPHEIFGAAKDIIPLCKNCGIIVIGPPCSGKTTILRDIARCISTEYKTVIIDERSEIAGIFNGKNSFDTGTSCVLNGFIKSDGMSMAVRSMAPEYIICDEFGGKQDIENAMFAMKSGVNIIASMHSADINDFLSKPFSEELIKSGIFKYYVFLKKDCGIEKIICKEELYA